MQRDKRCLIIRKLHAGLLLDDFIRLESHAEFILVQLPDVPQQRIGQHNALLVAVDSRRDMIGQRNVNAVRQLLAERDLRMVDNAFAHQKMRQRNACYQLLEPVGKLIRVQREPLFDLVRRCFVTCAAAEAQTAPHKHSLRTVFIQRDHNIVVEYLFYFHVRASCPAPQHASNASRAARTAFSSHRHRLNSLNPGSPIGTFSRRNCILLFSTRFAER